jgi:hypothetical protein
VNAPPLRRGQLSVQASVGSRCTHLYGGTGSAGGLLTRDILRRVFPVEEGQQARRSAIMCPHELHYEGQRGLSHRGANGWRLVTRGPRGEDGWRQDALLGTNASSGAAYTPMTQVIRMRDALCTIYHWVTTPDGDADPYTGLARPIAMRRPSDYPYATCRNTTADGFVDIA